MKKLSLSEVITYLLLFGAAPLLMPFFYFIILSIILSPLLLLEMTLTIPESIGNVANYLFPGLRFLVASGIFGLYVYILKKMDGAFGGARTFLFAIIFTASAIFNYLFSFGICAISVLKPCDVTRLLTLRGLVEIYDFYVICLMAFVVVNVFFYLKARRVGVTNNTG